MTFEEKEIAFKKYMVHEICKRTKTEPNNIVKTLVHDIFQDFMVEVDDINQALADENYELKEKLTAFNEAFRTFTSEINNYE